MELLPGCGEHFKVLCLGKVVAELNLYIYFFLFLEVTRFDNFGIVNFRIRRMQQIVSYVEKPVSFTLFDARWIPLSKRLVVVGSHAKGTGIWQVYELKGDRLELLHQVIK